MASPFAKFSLISITCVNASKRQPSESCRPRHKFCSSRRMTTTHLLWELCCEYHYRFVNFFAEINQKRAFLSYTHKTFGGYGLVKQLRSYFVRRLHFAAQTTTSHRILLTLTLSTCRSTSFASLAHTILRIQHIRDSSV